MQSYAGILNFLGQIFGLLVFILASISTLLIYSLLMNSTESKVFDSGVMRMLGLNKRGFVCMVFTQAIAFVIPSILIGYVCACPTIYLIEKNVFNMAKENLVFFPSAVATLLAVTIGAIIPLMSSLIPIRRALSVTLLESLNTARSTLSGTVIKIETKAGKAASYVLFGSLSVAIGLIIYICLP